MTGLGYDEQTVEYLRATGVDESLVRRVDELRRSAVSGSEYVQLLLDENAELRRQIAARGRRERF